MKKIMKKVKKGLAVILSFVMIAGVMPTLHKPIQVEAAAPIVKNINLNVDGNIAGITDPTSTAAEATVWTGSKVYFGNFETAPILWRVLDANTTEYSGNAAMLLQSDTILRKIAFDDTSPYSYVWADSTVRTYLSETFLNGFTTREQDAIVSSTKTAMYWEDSQPLSWITYAALSNDKVFLLDGSEANRPSYGYGSNAARKLTGGIGYWWLRSGTAHSDVASAMHPDGSFYYVNVSNVQAGVSPAFNLDLSSVLFTSASGAGKSSSFASVEDDKAADNKWNLTLQGTDSSLDAIVLNGNNSLIAGYPETNLTISHSPANILTDATQVSAMLTDSIGTVLYYGKVNDSTSETSSTIPIPAGLGVGSYNLYVFAESVNEGNRTDYGTPLGTPIAITISDQSAAHSVNITSTDCHVTKTETSGAENQSGLTTAMTDVVYRADEGYYFPLGYNVTSSNGIIVTRDSYTQITVSGIPTADTHISLNAATAKLKPTPPTGLSDGADKIEGTAITMEYASTADGTSWYSCTAGSTAVPPGIWYVRYAATETAYASTVTEVIVTSSYNPPALYGVTVIHGSGTGNYREGEIVTITADAPARRKQFKNWTVVSGGAILLDNRSRSTTFAMPANTVEVMANYCDLPVESNSNGKESSYGPEIAGDSSSPAINGWDAIKMYIEKRIKDNNLGSIIIHMKKSTVIPREIFEVLEGNDIRMTFVLEEGMEWIVNGKNINSESLPMKDINLHINRNSHNIPEKLLEEVEELENIPEHETLIQLSLAHEGSFGFSATLGIKLDKAKEGQFANLFYYNPVTRKLELESMGVIGKEGSTLLQFTHASDYVILIDKGNIFKDTAKEIKITPSKKILYIGGTIDKTTVLEADIPEILKNISEDMGSKLTIQYASSNPKIASVSAAGKITAKKPGAATITTTITMNGVKKSISTKISVKKAYIKLTKSTSTLKLGKSYVFQGVGYGVDTSKIIWKTTKKSIVIINKDGKAVAKTAGTDYVVAGVEGIQINVKVVVKK